MVNIRERGIFAVLQLRRKRMRKLVPVHTTVM